MSAFAKAYSLLRDPEQRKKADIVSRAHQFATQAGYYRYRDEMDFRALVAAKHPLVVEAYPELFPQELPTEELPEPETPELETSNQEPHSALKYIGPLAWERILYPNSVLTDELPPPVGVLVGACTEESTPSCEPLPHFEPEPETLPSPQPQATLPEEQGVEEQPTLWGQLRPLLLAVVGEQNFETWLSSVQQGPVFEKLIVFGVQNLFFQEYLTEHYAPVVGELLASLGEHRTFIFQATEEAPIVTPAKALEPTPDTSTRPPTTKWERRLDDLARAREHCTVYDPIYGKHILRIKEHAMLLDVLKLKWAEEDAPTPAPPIKRE